MADIGIDLTDDQIEQLLVEAERRLSVKQQQGNHGKGLTSESSQVVKPSAKPDSAQVITTTVPTKEKPQEVSVRIPEARRTKKEMAAQTKANAGPGWFNLPKTDLTESLKKDLQLLRMRSVLDSKRHYKKENMKIPEYCQVGTVIPGPTDFFSARMTKKERKRTLLDEVLEREDTTRKFKSKYGEIQAAKTSGKKGQYKKMMQKRYGKSYRPKG